MGFDAAQLYARVLCVLRHGYPLLCPEPNEALHPEYIENGIRYGDVGIIAPDGSFDFLFNICLPADHVINQSCGTPDNFAPVTWNGQIRRNSNFFQPGKPVYSRRAKCREISAEAMATVPGSPLGVGASIEISFDKESGAALMLPTGAKRENMLDLKAFREYAQANAASWYYFVNNTLGRDAENGSIYLVTGVDKSDAWENAVFDSSQSSQSCSLVFESVGIASGRMKLSQSSIYQSSVSSRASIANDHYNQALFIRGFRISLRSGLALRILGEVKAASTDKSPMKDIFSPAPRFGQSGHSFSMSWGRSSSGSGSGSPSTDGTSSSPESSGDSTTSSNSDWDRNSAGGSCSDTTSINEDDYFSPSQPYHPLISINNYILQNNPEIDVVVTHDDDWIRLLVDGDTLMPDDPILTRRFKERYRVLELNGIAILEPCLDASNEDTSARQNAWASTPPILPISGLTLPEDKEDTLMHGPLQHISPPSCHVPVVQAFGEISSQSPSRLAESLPIVDNQPSIQSQQPDESKSMPHQLHARQIPLTRRRRISELPFLSLLNIGTVFPDSMNQAMQSPGYESSASHGLFPSLPSVDTPYSTNQAMQNPKLGSLQSPYQLSPSQSEYGGRPTSTPLATPVANSYSSSSGLDYFTHPSTSSSTSHDGSSYDSGTYTLYHDIDPVEVENYLRKVHNLPSHVDVHLNSLPDPRPGVRPPQTIAALMLLAIWGSPSKRLSLNEICDAIAGRFKYYRDCNEPNAPWKNTIRRVLSLAPLEIVLVILDVGTTGNSISPLECVRAYYLASLGVGSTGSPIRGGINASGNLAQSPQEVQRRTKANIFRQDQFLFILFSVAEDYQPMLSRHRVSAPADTGFRRPVLPQFEIPGPDPAQLMYLIRPSL